MKVGDFLKINYNYSDAAEEPSLTGVEVLVIDYNPDWGVFAIEARIMSGKYVGETWFFHEDELSK